MVESSQHNAISDEADSDFESMLAMDTTEQQLHNTKTYSKLLEKACTSDVIKDSFFEDNKEPYFPTQDVGNVRSFMTTDSTN